MPGVLVIGSANVDLTMSVSRLPGPGETLGGGSFQQAMGGKGANQAVAARRAGAEVRFAGAVGKDSQGDAVLQALSAEGLDTRNVLRSGNSPTGVALILHDRSGENMIAVAPGANHDLLPEHIEPLFSEEAPPAMLLLQNELSPATLTACVAAARRRGLPVLINAAPVEGLKLQQLAGETHGLVVNETEAAALLGVPRVEAEHAPAAADKLRAAGFRFVVVTLGARGCCVSAAGGCFEQAAMPVQAVDATAAGDAFCGALAAAFVANTADMRGAVRFATAAGALAATRRGAQPSLPTRAEIEAALSCWPREA